MYRALFLALLLPLAACDEVGDAVDNAACQATGYADAGSVRATVSGDSFSGTCVRVQLQSGTLTIVGADNVVSQNDQEILSLTFPSTDLREYSLDPEVGVVATATYTARTEDPNDQGDEVYAATGGTIALDAYTESSAEGTFSFTGRTVGGDEVTVANGTFDVTF